MTFTAERTPNRSQGAEPINAPVDSGNWHAILLPSGRVDDIGGEHEDAALMRETAAMLEGLGVATTIVAPLTWRDPDAVNGEGLHHERCEQAATAITDVATDRRIIAIGHSLGGTTALHLGARWPCRGRLDRLVLMGTAIERPITVSSSIRTIDLIYGKRDHIAYVGEEMGEEIQVIPASLFGPRSAEHLVLSRCQRVQLTLLDGVGHSMRAHGSGSTTGLLNRIRAIANEWVSTASREVVGV